MQFCPLAQVGLRVSEALGSLRPKAEPLGILTVFYKQENKTQGMMGESTEWRLMFPPSGSGALPTLTGMGDSEATSHVAALQQLAPSE